jgi:hypothetical protein
MDIQGRRLADTPIDSFPETRAELLPGDYWLCKTLDGSRLLNTLENPEDDRAFWGNANDPRYAGNLTGLVMGCIDPLGHFGMLSIHTVRVEDDGTCSVRPGDGSSNSILIKRRADEPRWHGFIDHGRWHGAIEPPEVPAET